MPRLGEVNEAGYLRRKALASIIGYSLADLVYISATEKLRNYVAKTGGSEVPSGASLFDRVIGNPNARLKTAPHLAAYVSPINGTGSFVYGSYLQLIAANGVTEKFWITGAQLVPVTVPAQFQLCIGTGAAASETVIVEFPVYVTTDAGAYSPFIFRDKVEVAANTRIAIRSAGTSEASISVKITYETGLLT